MTTAEVSDATRKAKPRSLGGKALAMGLIVGLAGLAAALIWPRVSGEGGSLAVEEPLKPAKIDGAPRFRLFEGPLRLRQPPRRLGGEHQAAAVRRRALQEAGRHPHRAEILDPSSAHRQARRDGQPDRLLVPRADGARRHRRPLRQPTVPGHGARPGEASGSFRRRQRRRLGRGLADGDGPSHEGIADPLGRRSGLAGWRGTGLRQDSRRYERRVLPRLPTNSAACIRRAGRGGGRRVTSTESSSTWSGTRIS